MKADYALLDPTGNLTLLAETPAPPALQPRLAAALARLEPKAEQVGFFSCAGERFSLRMAGGEFCGNASLCAAVLTAMARGADALTAVGQVSGADAPVTARVERQADGLWRGTVDMPRPEAIETVALPGGGTLPVLRFPGISHVILRAPLPGAQAEALAPVWCAALGASALGLLFFDEAARSLTPLVYVPGAQTLCWESSCASGTAAVGAFLAAEAGAPVCLTLRQPGGSLTVEAAPGGAPRLTGDVRVLKREEG